MKRNRKTGVFSAIREAAATHRLLSAGTILCAIASVLASLLPPLLLARVIDTLTGGLSLPFTAALLYSRWKACFPPRRKPCLKCSARE